MFVAAQSPQGRLKSALCRSELAREKLSDAVFIQEARVIIDVFREQARSYRGKCLLNSARNAAGFTGLAK